MTRKRKNWGRRKKEWFEFQAFQVVDGKGKRESASVQILLWCFESQGRVSFYSWPLHWSSTPRKCQCSPQACNDQLVEPLYNFAHFNDLKQFSKSPTYITDHFTDLTAPITLAEYTLRWSLLITTVFPYYVLSVLYSQMNTAANNTQAFVSPCIKHASKT